MNQSPRCSVVIPTYNCLDFLPLVIASVRMQAIEDFEILVVDDGSTDGTGEWLAREAFLDRRIIPLQAHGQGPGFARNLAISHSRASLIAFLDADDLWWPNKLARQLEYHELNQDIGLSFTDYLHVDPRGEVRGTCFDYWRPAYVDRALSCLLQMSWGPQPWSLRERLCKTQMGLRAVRNLRRIGSSGCALPTLRRSPAARRQQRPT